VKNYIIVDGKAHGDVPFERGRMVIWDQEEWANRMNHMFSRNLFYVILLMVFTYSVILLTILYEQSLRGGPSPIPPFLDLAIVASLAIVLITIIMIWLIKVNQTAGLYEK
jgi:hypothetical protein